MENVSKLTIHNKLSDCILSLQIRNRVIHGFRNREPIENYQNLTEEITISHSSITISMISNVSS